MSTPAERVVRVAELIVCAEAMRVVLEQERAKVEKGKRS